MGPANDKHQTPTDRLKQGHRFIHHTTAASVDTWFRYFSYFHNLDMKTEIYNNSLKINGTTLQIILTTVAYIHKVLDFFGGRSVYFQVYNSGKKSKFLGEGNFHSD